MVQPGGDPGLAQRPPRASSFCSSVEAGLGEQLLDRDHPLKTLVARRHTTPIDPLPMRSNNR